MTTDRDREAFEANQYRKKPVVIEARQFCATFLHEQEALADWCGGLLRGTKLPPEERVILIPTLEGEMETSFGDWIICGVKGEFYPCKPDIFAATYEPATHAHAAGEAEPVEEVMCRHEAYHGQCAHCGVLIRNGKPVHAFAASPVSPPADGEEEMRPVTASEHAGLCGALQRASVPRDDLLAHTPAQPGEG